MKKDAAGVTGRPIRRLVQEVVFCTLAVVYMATGTPVEATVCNGPSNYCTYEEASPTVCGSSLGGANAACCGNGGNNGTSYCEWDAEFWLDYTIYTSCNGGQMTCECDKYGDNCIRTGDPLEEEGG